MKITIEKMFAQLLFWIYDFIDTIEEIFNILTGIQTFGDKNQSLIELFAQKSIGMDVLLGLVGVSFVITVACMCVKTVKNIIKIKSEGEATSSHAITLKQGGIAVISSIACIFFVFMFISFATMLLNMVNDVIAPGENVSLAKNLFNLSVQQSYVIDEETWMEREVDFYYDESGNRVQATDPTSDDGWAWKTDDFGNYLLDEKGNKQPIYVMQKERYHPYKTDDAGNMIIESGWCDGYSLNDIEWSYSPDKVFGVHYKVFGLEEEDKGYSREPMVRLQAFNLLTAYLVAVIILISMFMLAIGLVKRLYDIVVLIICMPLVCGTIPLDDGARFRAWRETLMSKVLVAFGAVIAVNVFYMMSGFIISAEFDSLFIGTSLDSTAFIIFKMVMLIGGAMCINGSQALIARILGTSADEGREAMQSFAMITSGVRLAAVGALGAARIAVGGSRLLFGGTNRYGRKQTGLLPMGFRGVNAIGSKVGGENYEKSRGARFVRFLGRMGRKSNDGDKSGAKSLSKLRISNPTSLAKIKDAGNKSSAAFKSASK